MRDSTSRSCQSAPPSTAPLLRVDGTCIRGTARIFAEIDAGLGAYWKMVGLQRSDAGDAKGARDAFTAAEAHLRDALAKQPGCVTAISTLIQILSWIGAPERDQSEWKKRLLDTQQMKRETEPYRSTFC